MVSGMRTFCHSLICLSILAVLLPVAGLTSDFDAAFRQRIYLVLAEELERRDPVYASRVLGRLSPGEGEQGRAELRRRLSLLLDEVEQHVERKDETREEWFQLRGELSKRQARRLLSNMVLASRNIVEGDADYVLGTSFAWAARRSRIPLDEARPFVLALLHSGVERATEGPEPAGILISGWTNRYEYSMETLYLFFGMRDDDVILEAVRDIQRFVVPRTVRVLPDTTTVRYAVRKRDKTALVRPDYSLLIEVDELSFTGSNLSLRPCMDLTLELTPKGSETPGWRPSYRYCSDDESHATAHELDGFYDEVAVDIKLRLGDYLRANR